VVVVFVLTIAIVSTQVKPPKEHRNYSEELRRQVRSAAAGAGHLRPYLSLGTRAPVLGHAEEYCLTAWRRPAGGNPRQVGVHIAVAVRMSAGITTLHVLQAKEPPMPAQE
jgi:hypothetical protein